MKINTLSGRTYNDLTQYPVFPWVLKDYKSKEIDLKDPKVYRDLSKPMGALNEKRRLEFQQRYENWADPNGEIPPFHYGTHYSSMGTVLYFLYRLEPFTSLYIQLQGGRFDHPERMFHSVFETWESASGQFGLIDVKELIPEFYYLPEFLINQNHYYFGKRVSNIILDDVELPPWAKNSPNEFIRIMRMALESDYVSRHLNEWIDLIFGYKQTGEEAVKAVNVFYYLTYEGAIDINKIKDPIKLEATLSQINNFGQTPKQLFKSPHPARNEIDELTQNEQKDIFHNTESIVMTIVKEIDEPIKLIRMKNEKSIFVGKEQIPINKQFTSFIAWNFPDNSLRILSYETNKILSCVETNITEKITFCTISNNERILLTGDQSGLINVWDLVKIENKKSKKIIIFQQSLIGHQSKITSLSISQTYNIIVSGSKDKFCIVWDLIKLKFIRTLTGFDGSIIDTKINHLSGEIMVCSKKSIKIFSINGKLLASAKKNYSQNQRIVCSQMANYSNYQNKHCYLTGHANGIIRFWKFSKNVQSNVEKELIQISELKISDHKLTSLFIHQNNRKIICGDKSGKVFELSLSFDNEVN